MQISIVTMREVILWSAKIAIAVAIAGLLAGFMQIGFIFTTKPLMPDLADLIRLRGLNLISIKKLVEINCSQSFACDLDIIIFSWSLLQKNCPR